eukprot:TRINITY_DN63270_c0_g1_i2.p3 TRINITY_DN63270_c0_g1~~TRINITY_DN63270_c0_g1_i2.p3  ORF type:complete len:133 (-),score=7.49 TRINITY_DN63270_c0_g1_i2:170-568(-)
MSHMHRINSLTGLNITVYHSFKDEVEHYRRHIWRCSGVCQHRAPFFGFVKRAMNRRPAAHDTWWNDHARSCNGTFVKIASPENVQKIKSAGKSEKQIKRSNSDAQQKSIVDFARRSVIASNKRTNCVVIDLT